jgi:hypothetical protein
MYAASTIDYADVVWDAWLRQAETVPADAGIDPQRSVLIAMSIDNRGIAVHPGSNWSGLGFETEVIKRTIDESSFAASAGSGDYDRALMQLIKAVDGELYTRREELGKSMQKLDLALMQLRGELDASALDSAPWFEELLELEGQLAEAREAFSVEDYATARGLFDALRVRHHSLAGRLEQAIDHHFWTRRFLPFVLTMLVLVGLGFWGSRRRRRYLEASRAVRAELGELRKKLGHAASRLLELELHHPLFFGGEVLSRSSGKTRATLERLAALADGLLLRLARLEALEKEATELASSGLLWSVEGVKAALRLLVRDELEVSAKTPPKRSLFLPERWEAHTERMTLATLYGDMDKDWSTLETQLEELEPKLLQTPVLLSQWLDAKRKLSDSMKALEALGLPCKRPQELLPAALLEGAEQRAALETDPLAHYDALCEGLPRLTAVAQEAERVLLAVQAIDRLGERFARSAARVQELRGQGVPLSDASFQPDTVLRQARERREGVPAWVEQWELRALESAAATLEELATTLDERLEQALEAKQSLGGRLDKMGERIEALAARLPATQRAIAALLEENTPSSLHPIVDNAEEVQALLQQAREQLAKARTELERLLVLDALHRCEQCERVLTAIEELYAEVEQMPSKLEAWEQVVQQRLARQDEAVAFVRAFEAPEGAPFATQLRERFEALFAQAEALRARAQALPHDWRGLHAELDALWETLRGEHQQAEQQCEAWKQFAAAYPGLKAERAALRTLLQGSKLDRKPANRAYRDARVLLDELKSERKQVDADWTRVLDKAQRAAALLQESRSLAEQDLSQGETAVEKLAKAMERLASTRGGLKDKTVLDAEESLAAAEKALRAKDYEKAIEVASLLLRTLWRKQGEKREVVETWGAWSQAQDSSWGSSSSSSRSRSSSSGRSSWGSSSGGSSWGSSSGGSSWGSSSGGSSWGSSSGGSSWGSSSGGSSWGSSSGGSSW